MLTCERVRAGDMITSAMDLISNLAKRPAARQMRASIATWAAQDERQP